jgi:DUF4097 and DUF4098 domain-containing protein YvlB
MPTFPTPQPIQVSLELAAGDARLTATERDDTVVEVRPRDPSRKADVRAAEDVRVELGDGRLLVKSTRQGLNRPGAVDVTIALPSGSRLDGKTGAGDLSADGVLGECTFKSGAGALRLGRIGPGRLVTGAGDISVEAADGNLLAVSGSGAIRLGTVARDAIVKSGNGAATIASVGGDARISTGSGDITIDRSRGTVVAKTAHGSIRASALESGEAGLRTAFGTIEIGIAEGTVARLDVQTERGTVRQELAPTGAPSDDARTVAVKARTGMGDIVVRRAAAAA